MLKLYIANKNYSSWSLRPWLLLHELGVPFEERLLPFGGNALRAVSPTGKVPCLVDGDTTVWDSLAITEYIAEVTINVWPSARHARAWARSAVAEMHSGFPAIRNAFTMNCGIRVHVETFPRPLMHELERLDALWQEGRSRFGGPFLGGKHFGAVDAFFAPVAFRMQTYSPPISPAAYDYAQLLLQLPWMTRWYEAALQETWRDAEHEAEARSAGSWLEDLRAQ